MGKPDKALSDPIAAAIARECFSLLQDLADEPETPADFECSGSRLQEMQAPDASGDHRP
jgi:hypothetical protein